jgi:hypothetical protein
MAVIELYGGALSIDLPDGWELRDDGGELRTLLAPPLAFGASLPVMSRAKPTHPNLVVDRAPVDETTLVDYARASLAALQQALPQFHLLDDHETTVGGIAAVSRTFTFTAPTHQVRVQQHQVTLVRPPWAYTFTGSGLPQTFAALAPLYAGVLRTIRFA